MGLISNGTTIFDNGAMASGFGGDMVFISSATASSSASIEFTLGDYKEYKFFFVNIHPSTDAVYFQFQCSTDGGSNYNTTITSTFFRAYHNEAGTTTLLAYATANDQAQGTSYQDLGVGVGADNDQSLSGTLQLFNPASSVYVKHFISRVNLSVDNEFTKEENIAGYFNDTNDLTNISFKFTSGNIDDGKILMFGVN